MMETSGKQRSQGDSSKDGSGSTWEALSMERKGCGSWLQKDSKVALQFPSK